MKVREVLGGPAWAMFVAMLILVDAMAANGDDLPDQTENSNVPAVTQHQRRLSDDAVSFEVQQLRGETGTDASLS